jgi:hypothetical protein
MGHPLIFDTLRYSKKLVAVGFTQQQAEAQTEALAEIVDDKLATKRDIEDLKKEIKELELRMTIKLGSIMLGGLGLLVILMKLFKL